MSGSPEPSSRDRETEEPPPILGSWRGLYALVALGLLLEILFCGWLTRAGR